MIAPLLALVALAAPLRGTLSASTPAVLAVVATNRVEFQVPKNDGWVTDLGKLLSDDEERALESRMEEWKRRTGHQLAVLTIPSLEGQSLEQAAIATARAWGIGADARDDGALLFVSRDDRALRIEVGRGLEGSLTDSVAGRIVRDVIVPRFRAGQFGAGIRAGVESVITVVEQGVEAVPGLVQQRNSRPPRTGLIVAFVFLIIILSRIRRRRGGAKGSGWRGGGPIFFPGSFGGGSGGSRGGGGGGFSGFGGGGFSGGGASGRW